MTKDLLGNAGIGIGRMEVPRQAKVEVDDVVEVSNEDVRGKR